MVKSVERDYAGSREVVSQGGRAGGHLAAQESLGACYANGRVAIDIASGMEGAIDAYQLVKLAEEKGCEGAAKTVDVISALLSPEELRGSGAPLPGIVLAETGPVNANRSPILYVSPELEELRQLVAGARAQLAELETDYTKEKSRVDAVQAALFRHLREHYQKRDRLRLMVDYRRKFLGSLTRGDAEEAKQAEKNFEQAKTQADKDYEELSAAADKKQQLTAEQEAELTRLWKKLVKLYHPDRFANEPDKLEAYHKLTAAINQAKDIGDIETLRRLRKTRKVSCCVKAGRVWISVTWKNWLNCAGCMKHYKKKLPPSRNR